MVRSFRTALLSGIPTQCAPMHRSRQEPGKRRMAGVLMDGVSELKDPKSNLRSLAGSKLPENPHANLDPRVAVASRLRAKSGAERIPFLVVCGTLNSRLSIARAFVASLETQGYEVETGWLQSSHGLTGPWVQRTSRSSLEFSRMRPEPDRTWQRSNHL